MSPSPTGSSLGIDFGTSHTIAVVRRADGSVRPLLFDGAPLMPSAVCADSEGTLLVGRDAVHSGRRRPDRFEPNPKRHIDRGSVLLGDREFPVIDVIAAVLRAVADECRRVVGPPGEVTVTVPAEWGPARRQVVEDAAAKAGLGRVRLVPEPVAAATYFAEALKHHIAVGSSIVVYDLGAGTFDASVVRRNEHGFETVALDGRGDLGGLDIDAALIGHLAATYGTHPAWHRLNNPTTVEERRSFREFHEEIRAAKERLSRHQQADIAIPLLHVEAHLTRGELETIAAPHLEQTIRVTQAVIRAARLEGTGAGVFLVGGASRMPLVATMLHRALGTAPTVLDQPEVVVAEGSVMWTEPVRPAPAPPMPGYSPQPPASSPPGPAMYPPTPAVPQPNRASLPPRQSAPDDVEPPPTPEGRAKAKRISRRVVVGIVVVDILIVIALIWIFNPDRSEGDETGTGGETGGLLGQSLDGTDAFDQIGDDLQAHDAAITATLAVDAADGPVLYTAGADRTVKQWDAATGEQIAEHVFDDDVNAMALMSFSDGTSKVVAIDGGVGLHLWDPATFEVEQISEGGPTGEQIQRISIVEIDGHPAFAVQTDQRYSVHDLETRSEVVDHELTDEQRDAYCHFAVVDGGPKLVTASADGALRLYDAETGEQDGEAFGPDPYWTAEASTVGALRVIDVDGVPHAMVFDNLLANFHLWNLEDRTAAYSPSKLDNPSARYLRETVEVDGEQIFLAYGADTNANLYSLDSGLPVDFLDSASGEKISAVSSEDLDGYTIALTGAEDGTVQLWSMES